MNNTFSWDRFCKVVNKDFRSMWPLFGTTMLILAAWPFAVWLMSLLADRSSTMPPAVRLAFIEMMAMLAAVMAPSRLYRTMNLRGEGIHYAMLPASRLEKYVSMLLFTLIVCPLTVYLGGMLVDTLLTALPVGTYRHWLWQGDMGFPFLMELSNSPAPNASDFPDGWFNAVLWTGYLALTSIFVFTATLFKRHKVIYTLLWMYLIEFVLMLLAIPVMMHVARTPDCMEWLYDTFNNWSSDRAARWMFGSAVVTNVAETVLFLWLAWRRLKRMPY